MIPSYASISPWTRSRNRSRVPSRRLRASWISSSTSLNFSRPAVKPAAMEAIVEASAPAMAATLTPPGVASAAAASSRYWTRGSVR